MYELSADGGQRISGAFCTRAFEHGFVLLRLYTDGLERGKEYQRYQLLLTGTSALPTYAIVDPATGDLITKRSGMMKVDKFEAFLDGAAGAYTSLGRAVE